MNAKSVDSRVHHAVGRWCHAGRWIAVLLLLRVAPVFGQFAGGLGSEEEPYLVATAEHLDAVRDHLGAHFQQTADIDLGVAPYNAGAGWDPIGAAGAPFSGSYDGKGNTIFNLFVDRDDTDGVGLFGATGSDAVLKGIRLQNVNVTGRDRTGGLAGHLAGTVTDCHVQGAVTGRDQVGGLAGDKSGSLGQSSAEVTVEGVNRVGGLVGQNADLIIASKASGSVDGDEEVGGLVGFGRDLQEALLADCYATGAVTGNQYTGGLVGRNYGVVRNCYATGAVTGNRMEGGLLGINNNRIWSSFWELGDDGRAGSSAGKGLTPAQMTTLDVYRNAGWAGTAWVMNNGSYPRLDWEDTGAPAIPGSHPVPLAGSGTPGDPYIVNSAADLEALSWYRDVLDAQIVLGSNLDAANATLYPIGDLGVFSGVFDGQHHTISNVTIHQPSSDFVGLFSHIALEGEVRDLRLEQVDVQGRDRVGALAGYLSGDYEIRPGENDLDLHFSRIEGCEVDGTVSGSVFVGGLAGLVDRGELLDSHAMVDVSGHVLVGGLAGWNFLGIIAEASAHGDVAGLGERVGGLVGEHDGLDIFGGIEGETYKLGSIKDSFACGAVTGANQVGGLAGSIVGDGAEIHRCFSTGPVTGSNDVGGVVGRFRSGTRSGGEIVDSHSTSSVSGYDHVGGLAGSSTERALILRSYSLAQVNGHESVGGLVGQLDGTATTIRKSFSLGSASGSGYIGGLVGSGSSFAVIEDCYSRASAHGQLTAGLVGNASQITIRRSYSTGAVTGPPGAQMLGGLVGFGLMNTVTDSYWDTQTSGRSGSAGGEGRTTEQMTHPHDPDTYVGWNFTSIWSEDTSAERNRGYPYLAGITPESSTVQVGVNPVEGGEAQGGGVFPFGDSATLTAEAATGYHFVHWTEDGRVVSANAVYTFPVGQDTTLIAHFALNQYSVTATVDPEGFGTVSGTGTYTHGDPVTLIAEANEGFRFINWTESGEEVSTDAEYAFTAIEVRALVAHFGFAIEFAGGSGVEGDPYLISSPLHLYNVRHFLDAHFELTDDIDLGSAPWNEDGGWEPIGLDEGFTGRFDGNGHVISNLTINRPHDSLLGLFGIVEGGEVRGVVLEDVSIVADRTTGGLIGLLDHGLVMDCHSSGTIHVGEWGQSAGGLVGSSWSGGVIEYSSSSAEVTGYGIIGGLVGGAGGTIRRSWATGPVTGSWYAGGLAGRIGGAFIEDCYAMGSVTDPRGWGPIGGFAGGERWLDIEMSVRNCYATGLVDGGEGEVGGLMGAWEDDGSEWILAELENCYWNTETTGQAWSPAGEGRTTAEMTHPHASNTYEGWDFDEVWAMDTDGTVNGGYPYLRGLDDDPDPGPDPVSYAEWAQDLPEGERGYHDTPAEDNIPNLLKYASGLDAMTAYGPQDVMAIYTNAAPEVFAIRFYRSKTAIDAQVGPQQTGSLTDTPWTTEGIDQRKLGEAGDREEWEASIPLSDHGFMRLKAAPVD